MSDDSSFLATGRDLIIERPPTPLPATIANDADLARWRDEREAATAEVGRLERDRRRMLASATVEAIRSHDDALATAKVRAERAGVVIEDAERKFAERAEREKAAQPERRRKHAAAVKARDEAERLMREVYGPSAAAIGACLAQLVELAAVVDAANRELPEGAERVPSPDAFRGYPERPTKYVDEMQTYYVDPDSGAEVQPYQYIPKVLGMVDGPSRFGTPIGGKSVELSPRTRMVKVKRDGRAAHVPAALARDVVLPGLLHADPAVWPARA